MADDPRILDQDELDAIARRIGREPVYASGLDCSQAFADRRHLLGHLVALEIAGRAALRLLGMSGEVLDLDAARRLARERQDTRAESPDL